MARMNQTVQPMASGHWIVLFFERLFPRRQPNRNGKEKQNNTNEQRGESGDL